MVGSIFKEWGFKCAQITGPFRAHKETTVGELLGIWEILFSQTTGPITILYEASLGQGD